MPNAKNKPLHKHLSPWMDKRNHLVGRLGRTPKGYRDLMWCPYINEPTIIVFDEKNNPTCKECNGNFEAETHLFIGHIYKPNYKLIGTIRGFFIERIL